MIRFLTDEDFNIRILSGVLRQLPDLDIVRVQDSGLRSYRDPLILQFAADEGRIVLSHDVSTLESHAAARILAGKPMPGLFLIHQHLAIGRAIDAIVIVTECSREGEWNGLIQYLPL